MSRPRKPGYCTGGCSGGKAGCLLIVAHDIDDHVRRRVVGRDGDVVAATVAAGERDVAGDGVSAGEVVDHTCARIRHGEAIGCQPADGRVARARPNSGNVHGPAIVTEARKPGAAAGSATLTFAVAVGGKVE